MTGTNKIFFKDENLMGDEKTGDWILDEFKKLGKVADIFISRRKSRFGDVFGFVKFGGVGDKWKLEEKLGNIRLGNLKISSKLERFNRDGLRIVYDSPYVIGLKHGGGVPSPRMPASWAAPAVPFLPGRSYTSITRGVMDCGKQKVIELGDRMTPTYVNGMVKLYRTSQRPPPSL
ncbi:hypothetical protein SSX86_016673 [Deinandra increscens subsp. villosa]|uniref:RRM domain-containing protein n=1 Tax=Deinandra increscens subsp. villosa TaxID=3103831 RepID=A0AAP0CYG4_9ASTR